METKVIQAEIVDLKAAADGTHTFSAYASTFGNVDRVGDVIVQGAFADSLKGQKRRPLLWQHHSDEPIGVEQSLVEDQHGLLGTWKLIDTTRGTDAYKLLKAGAINSMSIGYIPEEVAYDEQLGIRKLLKVELLENSVVSIPANEAALVTSVKHWELAELKTDAAFDDLIKQVTAHLMFGVDEAEALHSRRLSEKRVLSESHLSVLEKLSSELKGSIDRIEAILRAGRPDTAEANSASLLLEELRRRKALRDRRGDA